MRDELLRLAEQPTVGDRARAHAELDALDERCVLAPDRVVELEQLGDPRLGDAGAEEVVEEAVRALGRTPAANGPIDRFASPGKTLIPVFGQTK